MMVKYIVMKLYNVIYNINMEKGFLEKRKEMVGW